LCKLLSLIIAKIGGWGNDLDQVPLLLIAGRCNSSAMSKDEITQLQEQISHLIRTVDEISDVVARQEGEITQLSSRVQMLMQREANREADAGGSVVMTDQRPPHW